MWLCIYTEKGLENCQLFDFLGAFVHFCFLLCSAVFLFFYISSHQRGASA